MINEHDKDIALCRYELMLQEKEAELWQLYSHLNVEAFGEDIQEQAINRIHKLKDKETDKIKKLLQENKVLKKALELSIYDLTHSADYVPCENCIYNCRDCSGSCPDGMKIETKHYIDQARKELEVQDD